MKKPNIVFFVPDSYRGDVLGHLDNRGAVTPALDRLVAEDAVSYANAFAQNPVCTPSRCSFMTGWYPHVQGHRSMRNMLAPHEPNLLDVLRREDYHVWWGGKNDLVQVQAPEDYFRHCDEKFADPDGRYRKRCDRGLRRPAPLPTDDPRRGAFYDGVLRKDNPGEPWQNSDEMIVEGACDFLREAPADKPFFLYLPLVLPHPTYRAEEDFYNAVDPDRLPPRVPAPEVGSGELPALVDIRKSLGTDPISEETWREIKRIYYAMCANVDALFGRVIETLQAEGLYDDTFVFFFSDHGDFAGDYSLPEKTHLSLQDALLRVPLVVKPPRAFNTRPGVRTELVELLDITATLYDLLEIDPGYTVQGVSLRASLAGDPTPLHDAVFAEVGSRANEVAFINTDVDAMPPDSFYARQAAGSRPHAAAGSHAVCCRTDSYKYIRRCYTGHHELFDLQNDPGETNNLHGEKEYADVERQLETRLLDFLLQTTDVLPHETDSRHI